MCKHFLSIPSLLSHFHEFVIIENYGNWQISIRHAWSILCLQSLHLTLRYGKFESVLTICYFCTSSCNFKLCHYVLNISNSLHNLFETMCSNYYFWILCEMLVLVICIRLENAFECFWSVCV